MSLPASIPPQPGLQSTRRAALTRGVAFFALWMVLMQSTKPADLAIGALATFGATWLSLHLLAPTAGRLRFGSLFALLPHFIW
jgi:multicomponent Na+:H+ antiporter subunit E